MIDKIQNKCCFFSSCQPAAIITYCTNMRQYDVYELNISTIVEISDRSFILTHLQSKHTCRNTHRCKEMKEERRKAGGGSQRDWTSSGVWKGTDKLSCFFCHSKSFVVVK